MGLFDDFGMIDAGYICLAVSMGLDFARRRTISFSFYREMNRVNDCENNQDKLDFLAEAKDTIGSYTPLGPMSYLAKISHIKSINKMAFQVHEQIEFEKAAEDYKKNHPEQMEKTQISLEDM